MKGFFGKGEFSRGGPVLNEIKQVEELEDCSMNITATLSNERYINRLKWIDLKQNKQLENDFDSKFKSEFVNFKLTTDKKSETKFFKVNFTDHIPLDEEINSDKLIKTSNNPFLYKIKKVPNITISEPLALMYEEVCLKFSTKH